MTLTLGDGSTWVNDKRAGWWMTAPEEREATPTEEVLICTLLAHPPAAASPEPGAFTPQMAYEVWRDSERDEAEGETRWHLLADEINKRLAASPRATQAEPGAYAITLQRMIEAHCRGERVNETLSPHIGAMLNANLAAPRADATCPKCAEVDAACLKACPENSTQCVDEPDPELGRYLVLNENGDELIDTSNPAEVVARLHAMWVNVCAEAERLGERLRADATAGGVTVTDAMVEAVYGVLSDDVCDIVNRVDVEEWLDAALRAAQPETSGGDDA